LNGQETSEVNLPVWQFCILIKQTVIVSDF